jgi:hypothetical protein
LVCLAITSRTATRPSALTSSNLYWFMFLAHWAATGPRETVVNTVKSELGSDDRPSMTRQNRCTARSALRRFTSSGDGLDEAVLLGTTGEPTWVGKGFDWGPELLQPTKQTTRTAVTTPSTTEPSRVCTTHLPSIPIPLRNRADPGGQKVRGCLTTLIPRRCRTVMAREPVHNNRTVARVPCRKKSEHNRYRLDRTPRVQRPCCPRKHRQQGRLHCVSPAALYSSRSLREHPDWVVASVARAPSAVGLSESSHGRRSTHRADLGRRSRQAGGDDHQHIASDSYDPDALFQSYSHVNTDVNFRLIFGVQFTKGCPEGQFLNTHGDRFFVYPVGGKRACDPPLSPSQIDQLFAGMWAQANGASEDKDRCRKDPAEHPVPKRDRKPRFRSQYS